MGRRCSGLFFENPGQLAAIAAFADPLLVDRHAGFVQLVAGPAELSRLAAMGLKVTIDQQATDSYRDPPTLEQLKTIQGYDCYRSVEETLQSARALVRDRPDLARLACLSTYTVLGDWCSGPGVSPGNRFPMANNCER